MLGPRPIEQNRYPSSLKSPTGQQEAKRHQLHPSHPHSLLSGFVVEAIRTSIPQPRIQRLVKSKSVEPQPGHPSQFLGSGVEGLSEYVTNPQWRHSMYSIKLAILDEGENTELLE